MNGLSKLFTLQDIFMRTIKPHSQTGFAIVEVLIATVVLAIGFIELTRAFSNISSVAIRAVAMTRASNLTHATMERVMSQNFDAKGNDAGDYALVFDGTDDYIDVGNVTTGIKTISFWVEAGAISAHTDYVLDLNGADYIKIVNGEVTVNNIDSPTYYINAVAGERTIATVDSWYHVAVTTDTGINASDVDIGRVVTAAVGDDEYFDGKIDEVRLFNDVRTAPEILDYYNKSFPGPYAHGNLKLYYKLNSGSGSVIYDYSSSMVHKTINSATWTSQSSSWSATLGREGETIWSKHNDVDDFHTISFFDNDYAGLDAGTNNFTDIGGRVYVKYVSLNKSSTPYTFDNSGIPTDYKQITVKVGIPGTTDSTQLDAIKSAKADQGYTLTFSPYGI